MPSPVLPAPLLVTVHSLTRQLPLSWMPSPVLEDAVQFFTVELPAKMPTSPLLLAVQFAMVDPLVAWMPSNPLPPAVQSAMVHPLPAAMPKPTGMFLLALQRMTLQLSLTMMPVVPLRLEVQSNSPFPID